MFIKTWTINQRLIDESIIKRSSHKACFSPSGSRGSQLEGSVVRSESRAAALLQVRRGEAGFVPQRERPVTRLRGHLSLPGIQKQTSKTKRLYQYSTKNLFTRRTSFFSSNVPIWAFPRLLTYFQYLLTDSGRFNTCHFVFIM